jgi:palmitoyl-[glycerolipid] 3-(E)-desaturase
MRMRTFPPAALAASTLIYCQVHGFVSPSPELNAAARRTSLVLKSSTTSRPPPTALEEDELLVHDTANGELYTSESEVNSIIEKRSWTDDGFVFGLEGSGLERPKGRSASLVVEGDSLETKPYQVAMVLVTFVCHALFAVSSLSQMLEVNNFDLVRTAFQAVLLSISSWILADFGSGVLHWSVDNYGNGRTPVMGGIIAAFQGHHSAPWTIAQRGFCNNVHRLCIPFGPVPLGILSLVVGPFATFFLTVFCALEILSQEFHKWSHQLKSEVPSWVNTLQNAGLTIARKPHAQHHLAPFEGNYCIISGVCNPALDGWGFFRRFEHFIYKVNGVEANAWKLDPELRKRTLAGNYRLAVNSEPEIHETC